MATRPTPSPSPQPVTITSSTLTIAATSTASDDGIAAVTDGTGSFITIENSDDINAGGYGIVAGTTGAENNRITIDNSGDIVAGGALGIYATTSVTPPVLPATPASSSTIRAMSPRI